jgi:EmrB/QacA subfamily drug resistance transporter
MASLHLPHADIGLATASSGDHEVLSTVRKRMILAATVLGSSMAFIDGSVVNVALPALQNALAAGPEATQWAVNGYMLMLGALVLIGGAAADRFGRRRVFLVGIALFSLASLACGLAPTMAVLLAGRAAQGVGAALLTPASLAILGASFPKEERGRAIGAWAGFGALTMAAGPVLGGWLVDTVSWRAIFFINLPLAAGAAALAWRAIPESRTPGAKGLDVGGAALAAGGLGLLTWGLTRAGSVGFARPDVLGLLAAGVIQLAALVWVESRAPNAMAPPALFRSPAFLAANGLTLLLYFALGGALFFLPFELIRVRHFPATAAGAALLPFSLVMGTLSGAAGRLGDRLGPRLPLTIGPMIAAAGFGVFALAGPTLPYWASVLPATLLLAAGMTLAVAPLTTTVMTAVSDEHAGTASGINNAVARVAGLLAVAAMSLLFSLAYKAAGGFGTGLTGASSDAWAFEPAYKAVMLLAALCAVLAAVPGFFTPSKGRRPGQAL